MNSSHPSAMIDVHGMLRKASTPLSVDQLSLNGIKRIRMISPGKMDELIRWSVRTIIHKYRLTGSPASAVPVQQMESESRSEFKELFRQYQQTADATSAVEHSKQSLAEELEPTPFELDAELPTLAKSETSPTSGGNVLENSMLKRRIEKLIEHIATMEAALKTLSSAKVFSNQHVQNILRDLGLAPADKDFEKKKEMLRVVLNENQGIRRKAHELAARGIALEAPQGKAPWNGIHQSIEPAF
jgi:chaperonin cofactor prefoldin